MHSYKFVRARAWFSKWHIELDKIAFSEESAEKLVGYFGSALGRKLLTLMITYVCTHIHIYKMCIRDSRIRHDRNVC